MGAEITLAALQGAADRAGNLGGGCSHYLCGRTTFAATLRQFGSIPREQRHLAFDAGNVGVRIDISDHVPDDGKYYPALIERVAYPKRQLRLEK